MAVSFRNSPKVPKYSSIDVSFRDFWPQYFFHPLCILAGVGLGRGRKEHKCSKKEKARCRKEWVAVTRACLCRYPESSPESRDEKAVVSAGESWHFSGAGEAKDSFARYK